MSATFAVLPDRVAVTVRGRLGYETWRVMRDARVIALEKRLPLSLDISRCRGGDMGGLGALMIAQHQLGKLTITGCDQEFSTWFNKIGVCHRCDSRPDEASPCSGLKEDALVV